MLRGRGARWGAFTVRHVINKGGEVQPHGSLEEGVSGKNSSPVVLLKMPDPLPVAQVELAGGSSATLACSSSYGGDDYAISCFDGGAVTKQLLPQQTSVPIAAGDSGHVAFWNCVSCRRDDRGVAGGLKALVTSKNATCAACQMFEEQRAPSSGLRHLLLCGA